jgi:hypothetical protein
VSVLRWRARAAVALGLGALAACEPGARRLLLLDLNLTAPAVVAGTAAPWIAAGYQVDYRRYYPHVTGADPGRYRLVILLGGRAPQGPSDALRPADVAALTRWVSGGGVLVFGYTAAGEGSLDRWIMTRWLAALNAGIAIDTAPIRDTTAAPGAAPEPWLVPRRDGPLRGVAFTPFPAGRQHALAATGRRAVLATAGGVPAVAAARLRDGLIVVMSRHTLAALGPDIRSTTTAMVAAPELARTRNFLVALARWTLRPAEWAHVPPVGRPQPLDLAGAPRPLSSLPAPSAPPEGADTETLAGVPAESASAPLPLWARQGVRALRDERLLRPGAVGVTRMRSLDSLVEFLEAGGLTALWTRAATAAVAESSRWLAWERDAARNAWQQLTERLQTTSVRWLAAIDLLDVRLPRDTVELSALGDTVASWAALDPRLWDEVLRFGVRAVARLASEQPDVVAGTILDLGGYGTASGLSDPTFRVGLAAIPGDSVWKAALLTAPAAARYDSLLESGRLAAFYAALERAVALRAAALRTDARRFSRQLAFGVRAAAPTDWFTAGLLRGLGDSSAPALLFTDDARAGEVLARLRPAGLVAPSALRLSPGGIAPRSWARLGGLVFDAHVGFWLDGWAGASPVAPDSLARLVRQLTREARLPERTGRR